MEIPRKPLRLWPGVVIAILLGLLRFVLPAVVPDMLMYSVLGGLVGGVLVPVWWLPPRRAPRKSPVFPPTPPGRTRARDDGRDHPGRGWIRRADSDRRLHRQLPERPALAVDEDPGGAADCPAGHQIGRAPWRERAE